MWTRGSVEQEMGCLHGTPWDSCVTTEKFPVKSEEQAETCSRSFAFTLNIMGLFNVLRWGVI